MNINYLYKNNFDDIYESDVGKIVKIVDEKSKYNSKLLYESGSTFNGFCYKDYKNFENNPDEVCYIAESAFDETLLVDYVNDNKEKLIHDGCISTANSIKDEVRKELEYSGYYYEYEQGNIVYSILAKNFDDELINKIARHVFDTVDWQSTNSYIAETDWGEDITQYYKQKINKNRNYKLLCNCVDYINEHIESYSEMIDTFKRLGFTDEELEEFGIRDYDLEEELELR